MWRHMSLVALFRFLTDYLLYNSFCAYREHSCISIRINYTDKQS